ncbi:MAG: hypothetical protein ACTSQO_05390 [Candidatus Helarchaeota archaeon]
MRFAEIGKKSLKDESAGRILIEVPLILIDKLNFSSEKNEIIKKTKQYYDLLIDWINKFENEIRPINKMYIISLTNLDDLEKYINENFNFYEKFRDYLLQLLNNKTVELIEDEDLFLEFVGWLNTISSPEAMEIDYKIFQEVLQERQNYISNKILEDLKENEVGIFFINIDSDIQFPDTLNLIHFKPILLDEIFHLIEKSIGR